MWHCTFSSTTYAASAIPRPTGPLGTRPLPTGPLPTGPVQDPQPNGNNNNNNNRPRPTDPATGLPIEQSQGDRRPLPNAAAAAGVQTMAWAAVAGAVVGFAAVLL